VFNGIPSSTFNLVISSINDSGVIESPEGSGLNLITKKITRSPIEYLFGVEQTPALEFDLEITSQNPISAEDRSTIGSWLLGQQGYKKLQILQDDFANIYFNCIAVSSSVVFVGRLAYGWKIHLRCDSPWGWDYPKTITQSFSGSAIVNQSLSIVNPSANSYYTLPIVSFTTSSIGNSFSIINSNDANREFAFTGLLANETITTDNQKLLITSSTGLTRVSKFNLHWFRLLPNLNNLTIAGGITNYTITIPVAKKVGG
jgi:hypothetical protein